MMVIPEQKIEEIRAAANIYDFISPHIALRKRGRNYIGLCPFHNEKTPSFTVSEEKQIFHCFGCHAGGNVYRFIMDYQKISFIEAVQDVAKQVGISVEVTQTEQTEGPSEQEMLYDVNTIAARYFLENLLNAPEGETARKYFENRKIKLSTIRTFGLGYALPAWEAFINFARDKNIELNKAVQLGLIGKTNEGRLYDKFSGRIIFPIFSSTGRVIAFGGRILENRENTAKYLNSPESVVYTKGRVLYGLSHAKDDIRKLNKAILVEGYMDLISLHQAGVKNVVAVSGTALTEEQVQLLSRYTKNVVLLFDADAAGMKAAMRSIELLLQRDMEIKIASLPSGEDPDSYVNTYGKQAFEKIIDRAQNFLEYQTDYFQKQGLFNEPSTTADAIRELMKPVALIQDELKRSLLIKTIAKKFNLREMLLEDELRKTLAGHQREDQIEAKRRKNVESKVLAEILPADKQIPQHIFNLEVELIKLLFEGSEKVVELIVHHINDEMLLSEANAAIFNEVAEAYNADADLTAGALIGRIKDEKIQQYISNITLEKYSISKMWEELHPDEVRGNILEKYTKDVLCKYKHAHLDENAKEFYLEMENAQNDDDKIIIMKRLRELNREKQLISDELL
ncbi:MAG: DNA primase [Ignavibacteriaceae bacterium]|nr:DNA primase [Ignavibacteriaceae bacterium]